MTLTVISSCSPRTVLTPSWGKICLTYWESCRIFSSGWFCCLVTDSVLAFFSSVKVMLTTWRHTFHHHLGHIRGWQGYSSSCQGKRTSSPLLPVDEKWLKHKIYLIPSSFQWPLSLLIKIANQYYIIRERHYIIVVVILQDQVLMKLFSAKIRDQIWFATLTGAQTKKTFSFSCSADATQLLIQMLFHNQRYCDHLKSEELSPGPLHDELHSVKADKAPYSVLAKKWVQICPVTRLTCLPPPQSEYSLLFNVAKMQ